MPASVGEDYSSCLNNQLQHFSRYLSIPGWRRCTREAPSDAAAPSSLPNGSSPPATASVWTHHAVLGCSFGFSEKGPTWPLSRRTFERERGQGSSQLITDFCKSVSRNSYLIACPSNLSINLEQLITDNPWSPVCVSLPPLLSLPPPSPSPPEPPGLPLSKATRYIQNEIMLNFNLHYP